MSFHVRGHADPSMENPSVDPWIHGHVDLRTYVRIHVYIRSWNRIWDSTCGAPPTGVCVEYTQVEQHNSTSYHYVTTGIPWNVLHFILYIHVICPRWLVCLVGPYQLSYLGTHMLLGGDKLSGCYLSSDFYRHNNCQLLCELYFEGRTPVA